MLICSMLLGLLLSAVATASTVFMGTEHLTDEMEAAYIHTGNYNKDLVRQLTLARDYLDFRINLNNQLGIPSKLAVVLGVNNTALADEARLKKLFIHPPGFNKYARKDDEPVIWAIRAFYDYVLSQNVSLFFLTSRSESHRNQSEHNLVREGYRDWTELLMRPENFDGDAVQFKTQTRVEIEQRGYNIVLNISSKVEDLQGGHSSKVVLLPLPDSHRYRDVTTLNTLS